MKIESESGGMMIMMNTKNNRYVRENEICVDRDYDRFRKLLALIFKMCDLAGFEIEGRIAIKDKTTGKVWR